MIQSNNFTTKLCSIIATILLLFVLLITSAEAVCYWVPNWWEHEYVKHNSLKYINGEMSMDDAVKVTSSLLDYCKGKNVSLNRVEVSIDGKKRAFFSEREKLHLADCREIFVKTLTIRNAAVVLFAACLLVLFLFRKNTNNKKIALRYFQRTTIFCLILVAFVIILCIINFDKAFDFFHALLFDNDYWILDPNEDELINLMRLGVFSDTAAFIGSLWLAIALALLAISHRTLVAISRTTGD